MPLLCKEAPSSPGPCTVKWVTCPVALWPKLGVEGMIFLLEAAAGLKSTGGTLGSRCG